VDLTKKCVSPSVLTIFQNGFFYAVCKHFLHISCAHKTYVVTKFFVVECLEHENLYAKFKKKNLAKVMERGDKILKNGIFVISTCQKLTEILQVKFIYFSAIYANNVRRDGVG